MSCEPTWTHDDLRAIEEAIASGATRVKYIDREVQYQSRADLFATRELIRRALGCAASGLSGGRTYGAYSKGLCL